MKDKKKGEIAGTISPSKVRANSKNSAVKLTDQQTHAIEFYSNGFELQAPSLGGRHSKSGKIKRGEIKGWSKSSRRRFREFLLKNSVPDEFELQALTLTIPGPAISDFQLQKSIFDNFCLRIKKRKFPMVWRCEIQKRGQLHWHCMLGSLLSVHELKSMWLQSLKSVGMIGFTVEKWQSSCKHFPYEYECFAGENGDVIACYLDKCHSAYEQSADVQIISEKSQGWIRYLYDHTTKSKQEQIPENIGKHWGYINKKQFVESPVEFSESLTLKQYARVMRWFNRLCTPYIRFDGALFGRKRGFYWRRGKSGKSVYFSNPTTLKRMIELACSY